MGKIKEYSNGETTVIWEAGKCIHSAICAKGLPKVFRPRLRPWIKLDEAETEAIINQVKQCPSGALRYYMNDEKDNASETLETKVEVLENGPLLVYGTLKVVDKEGNEAIKNKITAFCRCGKSENKPYCDGAHVKAEFKG
ncbi:Zn-finger domain of CDGSH type-containing protein [Hyunsoonleella jejuensis]|uniref:Zn-finger domain of CDGSH type-containing protein n=1 Tax=Hyunsoonleella jejuensis TaxID=419940 RepID=A0A1H9D447_9FLAO|nr:(4Fe-4S)-binding protein [Hyunsoonleella jejuensis]SEQ08151.1 Zn-finger domain of CDGSH type-containing protein [Hyunsoonleella jejuensis]